MTILKGLAPAKVNLTLHVTGRRTDGYHLLDSLTVFVDVGDQITISPSSDLHLSVSGPFTEGVPTDGRNIVLQAAHVLKQRYDLSVGAEIKLEKQLPNAAGIGGGSSDAATALSMLARLWDVPEIPARDAEIIELGADIPVCLNAPNPTQMQGIGEHLATIPDLPDCAMVLVNPRVTVPTGPVFQGLESRTNPKMGDIPSAMTFADFAAWLSAQRNDLLEPAQVLAPEIKVALKKLRAQPSVKFASMSGSGATCFGLVESMAEARQVARAIQLAEMGWWVVPAQMLK